MADLVKTLAPGKMKFCKRSNGTDFSSVAVKAAIFFLDVIHEIIEIGEEIDDATCVRALGVVLRLGTCFCGLQASILVNRDGVFISKNLVDNIDGLR